MSFDADNYWMECVRRSGSNSAVSGWHDLADFIASGKADDQTLSGIYCALRGLSQECWDQLSERRRARRNA